MRSVFKAIFAAALAAASSLASAALLTYSVTGVLNGEVITDEDSGPHKLPLFDRGTPITFTIVLADGVPVPRVQPFGTAYHADVTDSLIGSHRFDAKSLCPARACSAVLDDGEMDTITVMGPIGAMPLPLSPIGPSWLLAQVQLRIADASGALLDDESLDVDLARVPLSLVRGHLALGGPGVHGGEADTLIGFDVLSITPFGDVLSISPFVDVAALELPAPASAGLALIGLFAAAGLRQRGTSRRRNT